mgnify:CR=1 FL=1
MKGFAGGYSFKKRRVSAATEALFKQYHVNNVESKNPQIMKALFFTLLSAIILSSCSRPSKDLATVEIGMTKEQVTGIVGEPVKKNVINNTEIWDYPDSNRTVVFRMDTVYSIMTSARARLDSINIWMDSTNSKVKEGFNNIGDKIGNTVDKIEDRADRDTSKVQ